MSTTGRSIRALSPVSRQPYNKNGGNRIPTTKAAVKNENEEVDQELVESQYDLTPLVTTVKEEPKRASTPSFSIDPWEVAGSPSDSIDSGKNKTKQAIVDKTPANDNLEKSTNAADSFNGKKESNNDDGDPDNEEDNEREDDYGPDSVAEDNTNGIAKTSNPANRFLMPSDIHPNMEQREDDIAQLRLLAGKLSADWRGQDFMAPALAR